MELNLKSGRAKKARINVMLSSKLRRKVLFLVVIILLALYAYLVIIEGRALGHLLLIPAALITVLLLWYYGELMKLVPSAPLASAKSIDDVLEPELLGRLKPDASPRDIANIVMKLPSGIFFNNRYGITLNFLDSLVSAQPADSAAVWQNARQIAVDGGEGENVSTATVAAALLFSIPDYNLYLAQIQLDGEDIVAGLSWQRHIDHILRTVIKKKPSGGLGRDLSFGWTPLLSRLGYNISRSVESGGLLHREIQGHHHIIKQMMHVLSQSGRRNATLVGEVGVGKTTLVYALAHQLLTSPKKVPDKLRYRQIIELDASSLISNSRGRGELEGLLIRIFNEALRAKNVILFLDEAQLFLQEGNGAVDLSNILRPVIEGGALPIILTMSDQEWLKLSQTNSGLSGMLNRIMVEPLGETDTIRVMEDQVLLLEAKNRIVFTHSAMKEAYKLANRFVRDSAFPGKAVKLLESAAGFPEDKYFITAKSVQEAVEKTFDVKVQQASSTEERDTLLNLEGRIHERMINQTRAVKVVSDALRRARAGVANQGKPIGTFLFLGPTGVGKTELSKSLAAVYFGGEDRMVRVDLNEYSQNSDVDKLLMVGSENSNSLCAQIARQPFSVVLLDEIEKAHESVLNVLLQMLDEGVLRDADNKPVSFRDAIVIATSNAGADKIRSHIENGERLESFEQQFVNELISSNQFRPEFINRFDEVVLFRPLDKRELMQVVDLLLLGINKILAAQKVSVNLTDSAKEFLVDNGYDPRLGARPLRRVTQRTIENVMAHRLLSGNIMPGSVVQLDRPELEAALADRQ